MTSGNRVILGNEPPPSGYRGKMRSVIRVLVADDQALLRAGFRVILESDGDIEVVAEAATGIEAVTRSREVQPDVILMDVRMPDLDGLAATEQILEQSDPPTVVMLTTFDQNEYVYRAIQAGASGFLLKDCPASRLLAAVRAAATGDSLIEPAITRRLIAGIAPTREPTPGIPKQLQVLTDREREVLHLMATGLSNAEIAQEMFVAETTVKTHIARILSKLGVRDRVQAVVLAFETGFAR